MPIHAGKICITDLSSGPGVHPVLFRSTHFSHYLVCALRDFGFEVELLFLRRHILALRELEDIFAAVYNLQCAVWKDHANVTGV